MSNSKRKKIIVLAYLVDGWMWKQLYGLYAAKNESWKKTKSSKGKLQISNERLLNYEIF